MIQIYSIRILFYILEVLCFWGSRWKLFLVKWSSSQFRFNFVFLSPIYSRFCICKPVQDTIQVWKNSPKPSYMQHLANNLQSWIQILWKVWLVQHIYVAYRLLPHYCLDDNFFQYWPGKNNQSYLQVNSLQFVIIPKFSIILLWW